MISTKHQIPHSLWIFIISTPGFSTSLQSLWKLSSVWCAREPAGEGAVSTERCCSLLTSALRCDHITPLLRQLHWLPVQRRVEFKIAYLVHQSLASLLPTYLTTDIHLVAEYGRRPLRSSTDRTLTVPRTHNRFGDRNFALAGPRLWNSLPISLRQI